MDKKSLIVFICNHGYASKAMDLARELGAKGGTVLMGKSSLTDKDQKFFKITIHPEKDVLLIVCLDEDKDKFMTNIYNKFGKDSKADGVIFSLEVDEMVGVKL